MNKIVCPNCESVGRKQTIGVVLDDGKISIQRGYYKPGYREFTFIKGNDFTLICGRCNNEIYKKGGKNDSNNGQQRVHRFTFSETVIRLGTQGSQNFA